MKIKPKYFDDFHVGDFFETEPNFISKDEIISNIKDGFYVTDLIGQGVNLITGDYSRGAGGFKIENGKISFPVNEVTIAGNLKDMFNRMIVANDLEFKYSLNSPTILIEGMTIAGI